MSKRLTQLYFSPGGTTAQIAAAVSARLSDEVDRVDLLRQSTLEETIYSREELVVVAMPVFAGRLPAVCPAQLSRHRGQQTPAVAMVVYGNRDYEDALLELVNLLRHNGFAVIGAAAFVARHSIFPQVAAGRPDGDDLAQIDDFAARLADKLAGDKATTARVKDRPLRDLVTPPMAILPTGDKRCTGCGHCVSLCPVGAIPPERPKQTDRERCITCTACIYGCPVGARAFRGVKYRMAARIFRKKCAARREPVIYI